MSPTELALEHAPRRHHHPPLPVRQVVGPRAHVPAAVRGPHLLDDVRDRPVGHLPFERMVAPKRARVAAQGARGASAAMLGVAAGVDGVAGREGAGDEGLAGLEAGEADGAGGHSGGQGGWVGGRYHLSARVRCFHLVVQPLVEGALAPDAVFIPICVIVLIFIYVIRES